MQVYTSKTLKKADKVVYLDDDFNIVDKDNSTMAKVWLGKDIFFIAPAKKITITKGGAGSGFYGHAGRPGEVGGSQASALGGLQVSNKYDASFAKRAVIMDGKVYEGIQTQAEFHTQVYARLVVGGLVPNSSLLKTQADLIISGGEQEDPEFETRVMALTDAYSIEINGPMSRIIIVQDKYPPVGMVSEGINHLLRKVQRDFKRGVIDLPHYEEININYATGWVSFPYREIDNVASIILTDNGNIIRYKHVVVTKEHKP
jgi:hypothetical protein